MRPYELTLAEAARAIAAKELAPMELTGSVLERIEAVEGRLGAYVTVLADTARQEAAQAEAAVRGAIGHLSELGARLVVPVSDYVRAQRSRTLMRRAWTRLFDAVDVIAAPTVTSTAARRDQETVRRPCGTVESVSGTYVRLSAPANITGVPSLSLPVGLDGAGLPIGMQLIGSPLGEATILGTGRVYEATRATTTPLAPITG